MQTTSPSMGRRTACLLVMLALTAGPANAAGETQVADVTVAWLETRGDVRGHAELAFMWALVQPGSIALDGAALTADQVGFLHETVESDLKVADLATVRSDPEPTSERGQWNNVTLRFDQVVQGAYMFLEAHDASVAWRGASATFEPMRAEVREPQKPPDLQPAMAASEGSGIQLTGDLTSLQVHGSFTVALWGVEAVVVHDGAERTIRSGYQSGRTGQAVDIADQSWTYLTMANGTLDLPPGAVPPGAVFLGGHDASFSTNGIVQAHGLGGDFLGEDVAPGAPFWATGRLHGRADSDGEILQARMDGEVDHAAIGGAVLGSPGAGFGWWLATAAVVVVAAAVAIALYPRAGGPWERLLARGRFERAERLASRRLKIHDDARARCALAVSLMRQEKAAEALVVVGAGDIHPATKAFLEAQAYAMLGDEAKARSRLARMLVLAPHLREHARRNPVLAGLITSDEAAYA